MLGRCGATPCEARHRRRKKHFTRNDVTGVATTGAQGLTSAQQHLACDNQEAARFHKLAADQSEPTGSWNTANKQVHCHRNSVIQINKCTVTVIP